MRILTIRTEYEHSLWRRVPWLFSVVGVVEKQSAGQNGITISDMFLYQTPKTSARSAGISR